MIITHKDQKQFGYCNRTVRPFFVKHGFDWNDYIKNGIESEKLVATGDAMALALVEYKEEKINGRK